MAETADTSKTTVSTPQAESEVSERRLSDEISYLKITSEEKKPGGNLISVWPPSQRSRDRIIESLVETLSTGSFFSYKYGTIESEEAYVVAKSVEEESYDVASRFMWSDPVGIKKLEVYNKEMSERTIKHAEHRLRVKKKSNLM